MIRLAGYEGTQLYGETLPLDAHRGTGQDKIGFTLRQPCGVVVAITPFNYPSLLVLHKLAPALAAGNTVVLVEHDLDAIATADWVIDMGPEGGAGGGTVVGEGTPEDIASTPGSHTGKFLAEIVDIDSEDNPDEDSPASRDVVSSPEFIQALEWAQAGVVVLQQSLPWPFTGVLPYSVDDNRPAHRALFAYARILYAQSPRKAKQWFRAMVYANPMDNMGARAFVNS